MHTNRNPFHGYRDPRATHAVGEILGYRRDGRPIYAIAGGATDPATGDGNGGTGDGTQGGQQGTGQPGNTGQQGGSQQGTQGGQNGQQSGDGQQGQTNGDNGEDELAKLDPAALAKMVRDLRAENAASRTNAKQSAAAEAREQLAQEIGKALGLVKSDDDKADPAKLAEQVSAAQQAQRAAAVELAVYKAAGKHGADPDALTDSRTFLDRVSKLDPTASDFPAKVADAVKKAVEDNPRYRAAGQAPPRSGAPLPGGTGSKGSTGPKSLHDAVAARIAGNG